MDHTTSESTHESTKSAEIEPEVSEPTPRSHIYLWTFCDILICLYAIIHIGLTFLLAWFTRSPAWALIFGFSSFAIIGIMSCLSCCCMRNTKEKRFYITVTGILTLCALFTVGLCASLLGWGAAGYSNFSRLNVATNVQLAEASGQSILRNADYGAFYFSNNNNTFLFSKAGRTLICAHCSNKPSCCQWLHVIPVVPGEKAEYYASNNDTVPMWIAATSYSIDPFWAVGGVATFNNVGARVWDSYLDEEHIEKALDDACVKTGCGGSKSSPVLVLDDVNQEKSYYNGFLIAGYVTSAVFVPLLLVLLVISFCVKI